MLLACSEDGTVRWTGNTQVQLDAGSDIDAILQEVEEHFSDQSSYVVETQTDSTGDPVVNVSMEPGYLWIVGPMQNRAVLDITSGSACFPLPDGMHVSDTY